MHRIAGVQPKRVLDVGCGTGTHARLMAERGCEVVGIDIDAGAIDVARAKCADLNGTAPRFDVMPVEQLTDRGFHAAVSLFHVVNYLDSTYALQSFFAAIAKRLESGSPLIFDCWNGVAALLDPPQEKRSEVEIDDERIAVVTIPTLDRFNQTVHVRNVVTVDRSRHFEFEYVSTLWTPRDLTAALDTAGFGVEAITKSFDPNMPADETTWKIMFTCKRR